MVLPTTVPDLQDPVTDAEIERQEKEKRKRKAKEKEIRVAPVLYWKRLVVEQVEKEVEEPDPQDPSKTVKVRRIVEERREVQVPRPVPVNTEAIPWPDFVLKAFRKYPGWGVMVLAGSIGPAVLVRNYLWAQHSSQANTFGVYVFVLLFVLLCTRMDKAVTRPGWVWRVDSQGQPWGDHQKWWKEEAAPWEDALRLYDIKTKKREFWLDATNENEVRWFWPWGYPMPDPQLHPAEDREDWRPTMADIAGIRTTGRSYQGLHKFQSERAQLISKLFFYSIIAGALILVLVAGQKAVNMVQAAVLVEQSVDSGIPNLPRESAPPASNTEPSTPPPGF